MNAWGILFMVFSWGLIIFLMGYSFTKVLKEK